MHIKKTLAGITAGALVAAGGMLPFAAGASGPYVLLNSYSTEPGQVLTIQGYQFGASTNVLVSLDGASTNATVSNGSFTAQLTVPTVSSGTYTLLATSPEREQASATLYINNSSAERQYYPSAAPSQWYVLPNQTLSFSGSGFAPNAHVTITGPSTISATTSGSGTLSTQPLTVPFSWQNSNQTFTITSPGSAYSIPLTVTIGKFYPNLNPSTYYIGVGQGMSASVSGFAPNEQINLMLNGTQVGQANADGSGNASFSFSAPNSGGSFTLAAQGVSSGVSTSRTITLHQ